MILLPGYASPGHKLGQMIGNFFEDFFSGTFQEISNNHGVYLDKKGLRPGVRGSRKKVTWTDKEGNSHDLDYVFEKDGSIEKRGKPIAFIELAWRRYTKHSRNKAGEIEGALIHLDRTYRDTCSFLGAILGGEFTEGAISQLESHGITVLYIPYNKLVDSFHTKNVDLNYPEDASSEIKSELIDVWNGLSTTEINEIKSTFSSLINRDYKRFENLLIESITRRVDEVRILGLFGQMMAFRTAQEAVTGLKAFELMMKNDLKFQKFEINVRFTNGDEVKASFRHRGDAIRFLNQYHN